jgi:hypothetical protein
LIDTLDAASVRSAIALMRVLRVQQADYLYRFTRRLTRKAQRKSANRPPHSATIVAIDIVPSRLEIAAQKTNS